MKKFLMLSALLVLSANSFAAQVHSAKLDASKKNILLNVSYGGGCGKHNFSLEVKGCLESYPVRCTAQLVHTGEDFCEAIIVDTVVLPLAKYGLNNSYYRGGSLTILGNDGYGDQKPSSVRVTLP